MADLTTIRIGDVPFTEAIDALRALLALSEEDLAALSEVAKQRAFTFTGAYSDSAAKALQQVLLDVLAGKVSRDQFRDTANQTLGAFGTDLTPFQADTIFETTLARVYGQGKDAQYRNPQFRLARPYVGLVTAHDNRVRHNHFALDYRRIRTVFRHDDMLWTVMHEPLGYRCRCTRLAFSDEQVRTLGLQIGRGEDWYGKPVEVTIPGGSTQVVNVLPDPGFGAGSLTARALRHAAAIITLMNHPEELAA